MHGENSVAEGFAKRLTDDLHRPATAPYNGESWDLTTDTLIREGNKQMLVREPRGEAGDDDEGGSRGQRGADRRPETAAQTQNRAEQPPTELRPTLQAPQAAHESAAYSELLLAALRLNETVERMFCGVVPINSK